MSDTVIPLNRRKLREERDYYHERADAALAKGDTEAFHTWARKYHQTASLIGEWGYRGDTYR